MMESGPKMVHSDEWEDAGGCCCFRISWGRQEHHLIGSDNSDTSYLLTEHQQCQDQHRSWLVKQLYKLKEVSELVAGPRWKTLLRKMGAYFGSNKKNKNGRDFRYNSQDYALNFDDGDAGDVGLGFSSRFAPPARS